MRGRMTKDHKTMSNIVLGEMHPYQSQKEKEKSPYNILKSV